MPKRNHRLAALWPSSAVLIAAALCALFVSAQRPQPSDDAYVTFRHVRNLLEQGRPAWNLHSPPVLGTTSPGYLFVLAVFSKITGMARLEWAALYLNSIINAIIVVYVFRTALRATSSFLPAILGAFLIGVNSVNVLIYSQGFESALYTAVLLIAVFYVQTGSARVAVILASAAPLIRPEGILLTPLVLGYLLLVRKFRWNLIFCYFPIPAIWLVVSSVYYGSPIPHSLIAIREFSSIYYPYSGETVGLLGRLFEMPSRTAKLVVEPLFPLVVGSVWTHKEWTLSESIRAVLLVAGTATSFCICAPQWKRIAAFAIYPILFALLFGALNYTKPWYYPSVVTLAQLSLFLGWCFLIQKVFQNAPGSGGLGRFAAWRANSAYLAVFALVAWGNKLALNRGEFDYADKGKVFARHPFGKLWELWEDQRHAHYRKAAELLNEVADDRTTALITEIGIFGTCFRGEVLDSVGLCSPESLAFYPPPKDDILRPDGELYGSAETIVPTAMVMQLRPDYVVNSRAYIAHLLREDSPFLEEYEEIARWGRIWGEPVLIYKRRDSSQPRPD